MAGLPELFCICTRYIKHACCMPSLLESTFCKGTSCIPFIFVSHPFSNTETLFLALILQKHFCLLATSSSGVTSYLLSPHLVILKLIRSDSFFFFLLWTDDTHSKISQEDTFVSPRSLFPTNQLDDLTELYCFNLRPNKEDCNDWSKKGKRCQLVL